MASTESAVLWVQLIEKPTATLMVAYVSGLVTFWDLEKHVRVHDLSLNDLGPVLVGMKVRGEKSHHSDQTADKDGTSVDAENANHPTIPDEVIADQPSK